MTSQQKTEDYIRHELRRSVRSFRMPDKNFVKRTILSNLGQKWDTIIAEQAMASGIAATARIFGLQQSTVRSVRDAELRRAKLNGAA